MLGKRNPQVTNMHRFNAIVLCLIITPKAVSLRSQQLSFIIMFTAVKILIVFP